MIVWNPLVEVLRGLREQRSRTIMTLIGLAWGAFSVVVLLAFGTSLEKLLHKRAGNVGRNLAVVWPQKTTKSFQGIGRGRSIGIKAEDVEKLPEQIRELELVSPEYIVYERVEIGPRVYRATLCGVSPAYGELRAWSLEFGGRFINEPDMNNRRRVAILGDGIKNALFDQKEALGKTIIMRGIPFVVIGVMAPKEQDRDYNGRDENRICIPGSTFEQVFGARVVHNFIYRARNLNLHARATERIYQVLGMRYRFDPEDRYALRIWDTTDSDMMRKHVFLGFNLMLGGSGVLTLLAGGVGVGNLMFIRVRQRAREIGIQIALGARPSWIMRGVLSESLVIVFIGGMIGFLMSWIVLWLTAQTPLTRHIGEPRISFFIAASTVLILGTIGMLAGYFPARRAARLDPVQTMADMAT